MGGAADLSAVDGLCYLFGGHRDRRPLQLDEHSFLHLNHAFLSPGNT